MRGRLISRTRLIVGFGLGLLAVACTSRVTGSNPSPTAHDPGDAPQMTAAEPGDSGGSMTCDLKASGLTYGRLDCAQCMQADCCTQTVACFSNNSECRALYTCVDQCPSRGVLLGGADGGGGDGGGDGGGMHHDAGPPSTGDTCVDACNARHPSAVAASAAYIACFRGQCLDHCK